MSIGRSRRYVLASLLVTLACAAVAIVMVSAAPTTHAAMKGTAELVLDFTRPDEVGARAKWSDPEEVIPSTEGLVWNGPLHRTHDIWIESTPVAVGFSWRPTFVVSIEAEVVYGRKWPFTEVVSVFPVGELYARYSPDRKHWSGWQYVQLQRSEDKLSASRAYKGLLRVPYRVRKPYGHFVSKYSTMDVPWRSDEEAVVHWILESDPTFFERHLPFIGYVQFLFETRLSDEHSLKSLTARLWYGTGGGHAPPKDKSVYEKRMGPWRFVAP